MMLSLLSEVHFWTLRDDIGISNSDFGAFRYHEKKNNEGSISFEGKKSYAEKRGHTWMPQNKRPSRLKENIRELEEQLLQQKVVFCQWRDSSLLQLMFSSGLFVNICVNVFTGDVVSITFDKFLVGKLLSDYVADVILTKSHLICSYNDSQLTLVYFSKPMLKHSAFKSFSRLDPRINSIELAGPSGRRLERKLACNVSGDMLMVWWHSSHDEVYPWSPIVKDQDRANVLVYGISGLKAELLCHHRSEFDLISVSFSQVHSNVVRGVEQKVSRNGDVTVESSSYQISRGSMLKTSAASVALPTHVCCHSFSPHQDKLLLGCIDGSIVLYDEAQGVTHVVKAAFIPAILSWHPDGGVLIIANERCQFQILDAALGTLKQQLLSEDVTPSKLLDITAYFRIQPTLRSIQWNKKSGTNFYVEKFAISDCFLLLLFERGPLAVVRFIGGGGLSGDIHNSGGFTTDSLVAQYLWVNQVDRAINLLQTLNWDIAGNTCLSCLQRIVNYLFKLPLTPDHEVQIQTALGCFHMPVRPMCPTTIEEFKAPVRDLTRRFFHLLLRYALFEKAFRLAIDLMDRDLFMDIHFSAKHTGKMEIADAAYKKAVELDNNSYSSSSSAASHSDCSRSSCSECSDSASTVSGSEDQELGGDVISESARHMRGIGKSDIVPQHGIPSPIGFGTKGSFPHPPLPVLTNIGLIPSAAINATQPLDCKTSLSGSEDKSVSVPSPWVKNTVNFQNKRASNEILPLDLKDSSDTDVKRGAQSTIPPRLPAVSSERLKVKFCDTVTQITLPDRLHTLPEEEEDPVLYTPPTSQFSSNKAPPEPRRDNVSSPNAMRFSPSSFTYSANKIGIPLVSPAPSRTSFPDRRNIDIEDPVLPSQSFPGAPSLSNWKTGFGMNAVGGGQTISSLTVRSQDEFPTLQYEPTRQNYSFLRKDDNHKIFKEFNYNRPYEEQEDVESNDMLGTEELSALLPGSRKPLATSVQSLDRSLHPIAFSNRSDRSEGDDNSFYINYNHSVHDLSEEEESNGTIKIVHFGVV